MRHSDAYKVGRQGQSVLHQLIESRLRSEEQRDRRGKPAPTFVLRETRVLATAHDQIEDALIGHQRLLSEYRRNSMAEAALFRFALILAEQDLLPPIPYEVAQKITALGRPMLSILQVRRMVKKPEEGGNVEV